MLKGRLVFIPRARLVSGKSDFSHPFVEPHNASHIPCLYIPYPHGSSKVLILFHGNAEDINNTKSLLETLSTFLGVHALAVEYPGYGIYAGEPSAERINQDAANVFDFIATQCNWGEQNIILVGRSIGSGPAIEHAVMRNPGALLLVSACTSLKDAVKCVAGSAFQIFVKDRFQNQQTIGKVRCPIFFLHGLKDQLIPYDHSQRLHAAATLAPTFLSLAHNMDHTSFDYINDLAEPFLLFLRKCHISLEPDPRTPPSINFPESLFVVPPHYPAVAAPGLFKKLILKLF
jgi:pimeloyl-ACP methyl ester carboxylesterase